MAEDTLTITVDGKPKELFMSYGILDEVSRQVGSVDNIGFISVDVTLRALVLNEILSPRDSEGVIQKPINFHVTTIKPAEINRVIDWVSEHLLDFFLKALQGSTEISKKLEALVLKMGGSESTSSQSGSATSPSPSPSAGPSR